MLLCDEQILERARTGMITPFVAGQVASVDRQSGAPIERGTPGSRPVISFGVSSYGYDFRVGNEFKVFKTTFMPMVDPKSFDERAFDTVFVADHDACIIPPNSFALAKSVEFFRIPRDILVVVLGKSTYARCGIVLNVTPLEPEWNGEITLEISNTTPLPAKIYAGEGIGQALFLEGSRICAWSYADKKGKYQNQLGVVPPRM